MAQSVADFLRTRGVSSASAPGDPIDEILARRGSQHLAGLVRSIHGQESNAGAVDTSRPNYAGARGPMQVIEPTFEQMKREGRIPADYRWDNDDHSTEAGIAYVEKLAEMTGGDPRLVAQGYYGGPGAIGREDRRDPRNPKAPTVGQYGDQVVARMGVTGPRAPAPQASGGPTSVWEYNRQQRQRAAQPAVDLEAALEQEGGTQTVDDGPKAPEVIPWMEVIQHPEYQRADETGREAIRQQYWQDIATRVPPAQRAAAKAAFDADTTGKGRLLGDLGASFGTGAGALVSGLGYLWGAATGNEDNVLTRAGDSARDYWQDRKSLALQGKELDRSAAVEAADGEVAKGLTAIKETVTDPRLLASFSAEQLPMFIPGGAVGRGAGAAARALGASGRVAGGVATGSAIGTGAALQGADAGQQTLEDITRLAVEQPEEVWRDMPAYVTLRERGMSHQQAAAAIATDLAKQTFAQGAGASALLTMLPGGRVIERVLAGASKNVAGGALAGAARGFIGESINEGLDEAASRVASNVAVQEVDPTRETTYGVGEAAGLGAVMGGVMGAPAGAYEGAQAAAARQGQPPAPPPGAHPAPPAAAGEPPPTTSRARNRQRGTNSDAQDAPLPAGDVLGTPAPQPAPDAPTSVTSSPPPEPDAPTSVTQPTPPEVPSGEGIPPAGPAPVAATDDANDAVPEAPETEQAEPDDEVTGETDFDAAAEEAEQPSAPAAPDAEPKPGTSAQGALSEQEASDLFDEVAAEVSAEQSAPAAESIPEGISAIDQAAHQAATSPANDLPKPTDAQKKAGNYRKGHVRVQGLDISIENPAGSERSGTGKDGKPWSVTMPGHYGYIKGTVGKDKDHIDITLGDGAENAALPVFVFNQADPDTGKFDEHKSFMGYPTIEAARQAYRSSFSGKFGQKMENNLLGIAKYTPEQFKAWLAEGDHKKPAQAPVATKTETAPGVHGDTFGINVKQAAEELSAKAGIDLVTIDGQQWTVRTTKTADSGARDVTVTGPDGKETQTGLAPGEKPIAAVRAVVKALKAADKDRQRGADKIRAAIRKAGARGISQVEALKQAGFDAENKEGDEAWQLVEPDINDDDETGKPFTGSFEKGRGVVFRDSTVSKKLAHRMKRQSQQQDARDRIMDQYARQAVDIVRAKGGTMNYIDLKAALERSLPKHKDLIADAMDATDSDGLLNVQMAREPSGKGWEYDTLYMLPEVGKTYDEETDRIDAERKAAEAAEKKAAKEKAAADKAAEKDAAAKHKKAVKHARIEGEREAFTAALAMPIVQENIEASDFAAVVAPHVAKWLDEQIKAAEPDPARAEGLREFKKALGTTKLADTFFKGLQREARAAAKKAELDRNRDPEVYATALAEYLEKNGIDAASDPEKVGPFKAGFDHALAGKTRSTITGDLTNIRDIGYKAGREWIATEEGKAWYEGKAYGRKLESTNKDRLRRPIDILKERRASVQSSDLEKAWKDIESSVARANVFQPKLADSATPGARRFVVEGIQRRIETFKELLGNQGWFTSRSRWDGENTFEERLEATARAGSEAHITRMMDLADEYVAYVQGVAEALDGAATVKELVEKLAKHLAVDARGWSYSRPDFKYWAKAPLLSLESYGAQREIARESKESDARRDVLRPPKLDRVERKGLKDHRGGKDITPERFKATFGFSAVQFGEWVQSKQDQDHLNYSYDAFMDLAELLGIPPKSIALAGTSLRSPLYFTIGALGHGKYAAHFSPAHPTEKGKKVAVINVTNTRGDGTVAHEWGHALDWALRKEGEESGAQHPAIARLVAALKDAPIDVDAEWEGILKSFLKGGWRFSGLGRKATPADHAKRAIDYYRNYQQARKRRNIGVSKYFLAASALDKGASTPYWSNNHELLARAWEAYLFDKLGREKASTYLVNPWVADGATTTPRYRGTPYPQGEERKHFAKAFDALLKAIEWKDGVPTLADGALDSLDMSKAWSEAANRAEDTLARMLEEQEAEEEAKKRAAEVQKNAAELEARRNAQEEAARKAAEAAAAAAEQPSEPMGVLTEDEASALFDEVAAQLEEGALESPDVPPAGTLAVEAAEEARSAPTSDDWNNLDYSKRHALLENTPYKSLPRVRHRLAGSRLSEVSPGERAEIAKALTAARAEGDKTSAVASQLVAEAVKLGVSGAEDALTGLAKLFSGKGVLRSFPAFDEESYKEAKPYFVSALRKFQESGRTLRDLFRVLIQQFGVGIKPYLIRFQQEMKLGMDLGAEVTPSIRVANWVRDQLKAGNEIDWGTLFDKADEAFGGSQAAGTYTSKDAYDALEAGVNLYLRDGNWKPDGVPIGAQRDIGNLKRMLAAIPTQTKRTAEMDEFQQFSTPPTYAYVVNWLANIQAGELALEPSAGIGGLAIFAEAAGARLVLNELSKRRSGVLRSLFPRAQHFTEDAAQLHNILPDDVRPTVIVMNPPFSATAGRVQGKRDTMEGARHIEQALKRLAPGGRLVAIVGEGMAADRPAFKDWWKKIQGEYTVRANVGVDGSGYAKYGTTFDNQILVIDKIGPTTGQPVTGKFDDIAKLPEALLGVRNARRAPTEKDQADQSGAPEPGGAGASAEESGGSRRPSPSGADSGGAGGAPGGGRVPGADPGRNGGATGGATGRRPGVGPRVRGEGESGGTAADGEGAAGGPQSPGGDVPGAVSAPRQDGVTVEAGERERAQGELTDSIFENYQPARVRIAGSQPHKGALVESAAMAAVDPPAPTYVPNLPKSVIESGDLSLPQVEVVVYAGQQHEKFLPNGDRAGFLIGDGTGVGKGREIAGIILDNFRRGRKKAIWISEKHGLANDALRDGVGVGLLQEFTETVERWKSSLPGAGKMQIHKHKEMKSGADIKADAGILFTAYSMLRSGGPPRNQRPGFAQGPATTNVDRIVKWVGPDFDGVLVFDEAHAMANNLDQRGARGKQSASGQALAAVELQRKLPKARVVYVSATAATEVRNLGYTHRLGLWGEGTPFPNVQEFVTKIAAAGVSAMELVARDLKAMGRYLARSLSYDGIKYTRVVHDLTETQVEAYDRVAGAWQTVLQNINAVMADTGQAKNGTAKGRAMSGFWSSHQRFFNQLITAMQMPTVLEQARKDFEAGYSPVFQLVNTNEAEQERKAAQREEDEDGSDEGLEFGPMDSLINYVRTSFPTQQYEERQDDEGNSIWVPVVDSDGNPVQNRDAIERREALIRDLEAIAQSTAVPGNPLDLIIEAFGADNVAEITGRGRRFVRKVAPDGTVTTEEQKRGHAATDVDAKAFQNDRKRVLVFSMAGGTGFSYHADNTKKNRRLRKHYLIQPGWQADKAMQGLGRTHRTNQAQTPEYILATTNLKAQKRFISSIARRLDQLGALTRGERRSTSQLFSAADNLESQYAIDALEQFWRDLYAGNIEIELPGQEATDEPDAAGHESAAFRAVAEQMGLALLGPDGNLAVSKLPTIQKFLNRLLSLNVAMQDQVFDAFHDRMQEKIEAAAQAGTLDVGLETLRALSVRKTLDEEVSEHAESGAKTRYVELELTKEAQLYEFDFVRGRAFAARKNLSGFYRDEQDGSIFMVIRRGQRVNAKGEVVKKAQRWTVAGAPRIVENLDSIETGGPHVRVEREAPWIDANFHGPADRKENLYWEERQRLVSAFNNRGEEAARKVVAEYISVDRKPLATAWVDAAVAAATVQKQERSIPRYTKLSDTEESAEVEAEWDRQYEAAPKTYTEKVHMITGAILPLWDRFPEGRARVGRTQTVDGERLLGRMIPNDQLQATLQRLGVNPYSKIAPAAILERVMDGQHAILSNGWIIKKVRVSNDWRIEVSSSSRSLPAEVGRLLVQQGAFHERIGWDDRYFIPVGNEEVLARIMKGKSVADFVGGTAKAVFSRSGSPVFYSAALKTVEGAKQAKMTAEQWEGWLKNQPGVKPEELAWLGLAEWLRGQGGKIVTRDEVAAYVRAHQVEVRETLKGQEAGQSADMLRAEQGDIVQRFNRAGYEIDGNPEDGPYLYRLDDPDEEIVIGGGEEPGDGLPMAVVRDFNRYVEIDNRLGIIYGSQAPEEFSAAPKYGAYQLPGGENYRELLLALPTKAGESPRDRLGGDPRELTPDEASRETGIEPDYFAEDSTVLMYPAGVYLERMPDGRYQVTAMDVDVMEDTLAAAELRLVRALAGENVLASDKDSAYRGPHWDEPNVIAHVRFNDRTDADGKRVLFLEEIQSDWHQQGRKKGYGQRKAYRVVTPDGKWWNSYTERELAEAEAAALKGKVEEYFPVGQIPDAPFKTTWPELALKRMIRWAAENGYDRVAWPPGDTQAGRFGVGSVVSMVEWAPLKDGWKRARLTPISDIQDAIALNVDREGIVRGGDNVGGLVDKPLDQVVGKAVAEKIMAEDYGSLDGEGLRIGAQGMRGFYDKILVDAANKLGKKFGAKVGAATVSAGIERSITDDDGNEQSYFAERRDQKAHALDITPALREAALQGLPLFRDQDGRQPRGASVAEVYRWLKSQPLFGYVHVVKDTAALRRVTGDPGVMPDTEGYYRLGDDKVYLVADKIPDLATAETLYRHEVEGHLAVELYADVTAAVGDILAAKGSKSIAPLWAEVAETQPNLDPRLHAREVIALVAERGTRFPAVDRLIGRARAILRKLGIKLSFTEADIRGVVARAARAATKAQARSVKSVKSVNGKEAAVQRRGGRPASPDHSGVLDALFKNLGGKQIAKILTSPLYDRLIRAGGRLTPEKVKQALVSDYGLPEPYLDAKIDKQAAINKVLRKTRNLIDLLGHLDREQSRIAYLWMTTDPERTDDDGMAVAAQLMEQLPEDSREALRIMKDAVDELGRQAVEVGLLTEDSYQRNRMAYLHRSYRRHMVDRGESIQARHKRNAATRADNYKGRGLRDDVSPESLGEFELGDKRLRIELRGPRGGLREVKYVPLDEAVPDGWTVDGEWEIRWLEQRPGMGEKAGMWRDLTAEERQRLGEIEEVRFAFAKTMLNAINDIENQKFLAWVGETYAVDPEDVEPENMVEAGEGFLSLRTYRPDQYVKVPKVGIPKTPGIKKYGKLSGKVIPAVMWNDIRNAMALPESEVGRYFNSIMRAWKISKTALSPTVHTNNVMSNFILADLAEVRARDISRALAVKIMANRKDEASVEAVVRRLAAKAGVHSVEEAKELLARYEDSGAEQGSFHAMELQQDIIRPLLEEMEAAEANGLLGDLTAVQIVSLLRAGEVKTAMQAIGQKAGIRHAIAGGKKMIDVYRNEDTVFRFAKFIRESEAGRNDRDAGKAARDAFLNYEINAPAIQFARRTVLPFIAFSYRAIPKIIEAAARKPWKLAKYFAVASALNSLAYGMLGLSDDDEDRERALLPEELQGRVLGIFPRLMRLPWNDKNDAPVFLDVRRWVPAGDIMDTTGSHSAIPLPNWLSVGGPLAFALEVIANKSMFTGEPIVKETDTAGQKASKLADYAFKWASPNVPLPNPLNFVLPAGRDGDEPRFIDLGAIPGIDRDQMQTYAWTGVLRAGTGREDAFGRETGSIRQALASSIGVKARSYPADIAKSRVSGELARSEAEIDRNIRQLARERARGGLTEAEYRERLGVELDKKRRLYERASEQLRGAERSK